MKDYLVNCIDDIPSKINSYIFKQEQVDLSHIYIDGTKITANASKYSWVWKKSSVKNRDKVFNKITELLNEINKITSMQGVKFEIRTEYAIEYMKQITEQYVELVCIKPECIVRGKGHRKTPEQRNYDMLVEYTEKLKKYAKHINICGESRNSYSKTDSDATFFRIKRDYMGNDQLLPGYNFQLGICVTFICKQLFLNTGGKHCLPHMMSTFLNYILQIIRILHRHIELIVIVHIGRNTGIHSLRVGLNNFRI